MTARARPMALSRWPVMPKGGVRAAPILPWRWPSGLGRTERTAAAIIVILGAASAGLAVAVGAWYVALAIALAIPATALLIVYPWAAVLVWALVMPYFFGRATATNLAFVWSVHRLLIPFMLVLLVVYHRMGIRRSPFRVRSWDVALVAFIGVAAVNILLLSQDPTRRLVAFHDQVAVPICLFWLMRALGPTERDLRRLVMVAFVTVAVQGTVGLLSWFAPSALPAEWLGRAGERSVGTIGSPAPFTATIVLFGIFLLQFARTTHRSWIRLGAAALLVVGLAAIFFSFSRGSWIGAGLVFVGLVPLYPRLAITLGTAAVIGGVLLGTGPLASEIVYAQERVSDADTVAGRIVTNDAAFAMIENKPVMGWGFGNFELFDEQFKRSVAGFSLEQGGGASLHNAYLGIAAELGIPALVLYFVPVLLLGVATIRAWPYVPRDGFIDRRLLGLLWLALLDQFVVSNFMDMLHSYPWGTGLWWATLGVIAVIVTSALRPARARWERAP